MDPHGTCPPNGTDRRLALTLSVVALVAFAPGLFWGLPYGKAINGAYQILDGRMIYRDFWTMYAPGMFYLTAGVFKFIGREVVFQGAVAILIRAGIVATLFLLLRCLGLTRRLASVLSLVLAAGMWQTNPEIISYHPALLLLLLFLTQMIRYFHEGRARTLFFAGVWAGFAACFKHDVAAYFVLSSILGLSLAWTLTVRPRPPHWISPLKAAGYVSLGTLVCFLPVVAWIAAKASSDAWQDLFVFPATVFAKVRREPYAPMLPRLDLIWDWLADPFWLNKGRTALYSLTHWIQSNLPQYVFLLGVGVVIGRRRAVSGPQLATMLVLTAGIPFFWLAAHVQQNTHLLTMAVLSALLVTVVWTSLPRKPRWANRVLAGSAALYGLGLVLPSLLTTSYIAQEWAEHQTMDLPGVRWIRLPRAQYEIYEPIARFLREHTKEGDYIYVGLERHDFIVINDPRFYYLANRISCCRYSELHPGVTDLPDQQQEIIRDIEMHDVRAAVLWQFGGPNQDTVRLHQIMERRAAALPGTGATLLDEYLSYHFSPVMTRGKHTVVWRNDLPPPDENR